MTNTTKLRFRLPTRLRPLLIGLPAFILVWELLAVWRAPHIVRGYLIPLVEKTGGKVAYIASKSPEVAMVSFAGVTIAFILMMGAFLLAWRAVRLIFNRWTQRRP